MGLWSSAELWCCVRHVPAEVTSDAMAVTIICRIAICWISLGKEI